MYKEVVLNSEISKVLSELGHGDFIAVGDCGLPIPEGVKKIDVAIQPGTPSFEDLYELLRKSMHVEKKIYAIEADDPALLEIMDDDIPYEKVSHEELKKRLKHAKAVIRTGSVIPYSNVLMYSNVFF
ncbi:D-ribose pyranase [Salinicoccus roseus]|uniref:D-ribose pyranase n=1 Tax=Salinicoccus roseus TaxID=45670 RepID=UPI001CA64267|nr:D-ribose pyranase [Salinicoccus roseus]MBY8909932.1 D-ribose pyranase [Salinicoccus roseus]